MGCIFFSFIVIKQKVACSVSIALDVYKTGARSSGAHGSEVQDSGFVPLQGIWGGFVLIHVIKKQEAEPEEVSWGFGPESNYRVLLRVHHWADTPTCVSLQHKYQQRVYVPSEMSLRIENLTQEDSGQYRARASFQGGIDLTQVFHLTVYGKWHLLTPSNGFPPFVVEVSHMHQFSGLFPDTSLQTLFSPLKLG